MSTDQRSSVSEHYAGGGAADYFEYQVNGAERNNRIAKRFFDPHLKPTDDVVDYGCGTGWLLSMLDVRSALGIEPNPNSRSVAAEIGVETVASPADVADASADVVISNHALEHSLNPLEELREIRRIVKPSGRVVICLPVDDWRRENGLDASDPNHHLFTWTPLGFSNLLIEAGLRPDSVRAFSYLQSPPEWRLDWLPRRAFDAFARFNGLRARYHQMLAVARRAS